MDDAANLSTPLASKKRGYFFVGVSIVNHERKPGLPRQLNELAKEPPLNVPR